MNVIAPTQKERLTNILNKTKFSVSIDESTNITNKQSMCIVVRYFNEEIGRVHDSLGIWYQFSMVTRTVRLMRRQ